jgi:hypothetical protein
MIGYLPFVPAKFAVSNTSCSVEMLAALDVKTNKFHGFSGRIGRLTGGIASDGECH